MLFVEAPQSLDELKRVVEVLRPLGKPLMANMIEHGKTPGLTAKALEDMGFSAVFFPDAPCTPWPSLSLSCLRH